MTNTNENKKVALCEKCNSSDCYGANGTMCIREFGYFD